MFLLFLDVLVAGLFQCVFTLCTILPINIYVYVFLNLLVTKCSFSFIWILDMYKIEKMMRLISWFCVFLILYWFQVYFSVLSLHAHFSPLIYGSVIGLIAHFKILQSKSEPVSLNSLGYLNIMSNGTTSTNNFCFSISANLESVNVHVNLENDGANSSVLMLSQRELDIR